MRLTLGRMDEEMRSEEKKKEKKRKEKKRKTRAPPHNTIRRYVRRYHVAVGGGRAVVQHNIYVDTHTQSTSCGNSAVGCWCNVVFPVAQDLFLRASSLRDPQCYHRAQSCIPNYLPMYVHNPRPRRTVYLSMYRSAANALDRQKEKRIKKKSKKINRMLRTPGSTRAAVGQPAYARYHETAFPRAGRGGAERVSSSKPSKRGGRAAINTFAVIVTLPGGLHYRDAGAAGGRGFRSGVCSDGDDDDDDDGRFRATCQTR